MITHWFIAMLLWWGPLHQRPILYPPIYIPPTVEQPIEAPDVP